MSQILFIGATSGRSLLQFLRRVRRNGPDRPQALACAIGPRSWTEPAMVRGQGRATRQARVAHGLSRSRSCNRCCMGHPIERCASRSDIVSSIVLRLALMSSSVTVRGSTSPNTGLICLRQRHQSSRARGRLARPFFSAAIASAERARWIDRQLLNALRRHVFAAAMVGEGASPVLQQPPSSSWRSTASVASEITPTVR